MQQPESPIPQWKPEENKILDNRLALNPAKGDPEDKIFHISFKHYNNSLCEIPILFKNRAKRALENLKTIGWCHDLKSLRENGIDILPVTPAGAYKKLFTQSVTEDVELKEHKIEGDARLFYFIVGKMFYIVAITNN